MLPENSGQTLKLYKATVIKTDKNEDKQENKVQFKISPYMDNWTQNHLPWAFPFLLSLGATDSKKTTINQIPLINSEIWVGQLHLVWHYFGDCRARNQVLAKYYFDNIKDNLFSFIYDYGFSVNFDVKDNNAFFSFVHPSGTCIQIDKDGNTGLYSAKNIEIRTKNGNILKMDDQGISGTIKKGFDFKDDNNNEIKGDTTGVIITDGVNNNKIKMSSQGVVINDNFLALL